jgi:hypothetical protein
MTRINANIPVANLTDQHLRAEHREIVRVCGKYEKRLKKTIDTGIDHISMTHNFKMGQGHELFFVDKGAFTLNRYRNLRDECKRRGFETSDFEHAWRVYRKQDMKWHNFTEAENNLVRERIRTRLVDSSQIPRHEKTNISVDQAINMINRLAE